MTVECGRVDCVGDTDSQLLNLSNSLHSAEDMKITPKNIYMCIVLSVCSFTAVRPKDIDIFYLKESILNS